MPQKQIGFDNRSVIQLDILLDFYGKERKIGCTIYLALVDSIAYK
jgi:hypothetical protein